VTANGFPQLLHSSSSPFSRSFSDAECTYPQCGQVQVGTGSGFLLRFATGSLWLAIFVNNTKEPGEWRSLNSKAITPRTSGYQLRFVSLEVTSPGILFDFRVKTFSRVVNVGWLHKLSGRVPNRSLFSQIENVVHNQRSLQLVRTSCSYFRAKRSRPPQFRSGLC
jgi:hypothetical protein